MKVSRVFQGCFMKGSRLFQGRWKGVPREFGALRGLKGCLKEVPWMFEKSFKCVSRMFQGSFKSNIKGCLKGVSKTLLKSFKGV